MSGFAIIWHHRQLFLIGLANTVSLTAICFLVSVPVSIGVAVVLLETKGPIRWFVREFVDLMRCVPFLLLAYVVYYGLPSIGLSLDAWWAGLATLIIYNVAYLIEIFRATALALPAGPLDAARAFGMTKLQIYRRIVFPQIIVLSAPVLGNQVIMMIKDSAFLMIITVQEISFAANFITTNYFLPFLPFTIAIGLYWGLCLVVEFMVRRLRNVQKRQYG